MQQCITNFRSELLHNRLNFGLKMSTHPEIQRFNRLVEKEFGFKKFILKINPEMKVKSMTYPITHDTKALSPFKQPKDYLIVSRDGYKFKPEACYVTMVILYMGIISNPDLTDRDIMAIILMEIGHNFEAAISKTGSILSYANNIGTICGSLSINLPNRRLFKFTRDLYKLLLKKNIDIALSNIGMDYLEPLYNALISIQRFFVFVKYPITKVIDLVFSPHKMISSLNDIEKIIDPMEIINKILRGDYRNQNIADNFATMYGYGVEISRVQRVLQGDEIYNKIEIPVISPLLGFFSATLLYTLTLLDPAKPFPITRIKNQIKYLEKELNEDDAIDNETKKEIMKQVNEIYKELELATDIRNNLSNYSLFEKVYSKILLVCFFGDIRNPILSYNNVYRDIQSVYDENVYDEQSLNDRLDNLKLL